VSLSDSFEREVRILCFSSTIARWEDTEEDLEDVGVCVDGVWVWEWDFGFFIEGFVV
jgi:hypothetical protein